MTTTTKTASATLTTSITTSLKGSGHELLLLEAEPEFTTSDDLEREALYRSLGDLYLECGLDVDAVEQTAFRRTEFLEKRSDYLNDRFGARAGLEGEVN
jgi:hypothetical protein